MRAQLPEIYLNDLRNYGDAGLDLRALLPEGIDFITLNPGEQHIFDTGLTGLMLNLLPNHAALAIPRSGTAAKNMISVTNAPGLIDAGYDGPIKVIIVNMHPEESFTVNNLDRIAQLVVIEHFAALYFGEGENTRGGGGFGSTGRN